VRFAILLQSPDSLELSTICHNNRFAWLATWRAQSLALLDDVIALGHLAKDDVTTIKPRANHSGDEKLRAVGARAGVGHAE